MLSSVMSHQIGEKVTMWELLAPVVSHHGVFLSSTDLLKACLSPLIDSGLVEREQKLTPTGRPYTAFSKGDKRRLRLRIRLSLVGCTTTDARVLMRT